MLLSHGKQLDTHFSSKETNTGGSKTNPHLQDIQKTFPIKWWPVLLSSYWKYDTELGQMSAGYPRDISDWTNIPHNVDAAFTWRNGKTYFFKSGEYWRYADDGDLDRNNQPFPRNAGRWWFGCSQTSIRRQPLVDYNDEFVEVGFKGPTK